MNPDIQTYNNQQIGQFGTICEFLAKAISSQLPEAENKIWHRHPVWFLEGNPVVGYSLQKPGVRLMFWSGASFEEPNLKATEGKFKDASIFYNTLEEIKQEDLIRWLEKAKTIQWDYKNLIKRKSKLERL